MQEKWCIYNGKKITAETPPPDLPEPPPWRAFDGKPLVERKLPPLTNQTARRFGRGEVFQADEKVINMVNGAIYLHRPLLVTGPPGIGKSSLAYSIALNLQLGPVLRWSITSRSTLKEALYSYDAIGRLQAVNLGEHAQIGDFIQLGPLGTSLLPTARPRVLLIDEIDKSDIDLPNDLLHAFEEGHYTIPELVRFHRQLHRQKIVDEGVEVRPYDANPEDIADTVRVYQGRVQCKAFPIVVLTSNGERELPPAFLRRCLQLEIKPPEKPQLEEIIKAHLGAVPTQSGDINLLDYFMTHRKKRMLATDQLLNAIYLLTEGFQLDTQFDEKMLLDDILKSLTGS